MNGVCPLFKNQVAVAVIIIRFCAIMLSFWHSRTPGECDKNRRSWPHLQVRGLKRAKKCPLRVQNIKFSREKSYGRTALALWPYVQRVSARTAWGAKAVRPKAAWTYGHRVFEWQWTESTRIAQWKIAQKNDILCSIQTTPFFQIALFGQHFSDVKMPFSQWEPGHGLGTGEGQGRVERGSFTLTLWKGSQPFIYRCAPRGTRTGQCPAEKPRLARSLRKMGRTLTCPLSRVE